MASANQQPCNVLYIMCDSLPPLLTGPYGDRVGHTPHLDRLAAEGVTFTRAYCNSPLCAPSRASMVTGRYVGELGAFDNADEFSSNWPTIGDLYGAAGYQTSIIGKMHFVGHDQHHGFDERIALQTDYSQGFNPDYFRLAYDWAQPSGPNPAGLEWMSDSYVNSERWEDYRQHYNRDETIHAQALRYLSARDALSLPFFACVSYHAPHNPFWIQPEVRARFAQCDLPLPTIPEGVALCQGVMDQWLNDFHGMTEEVRAQVMTEENLRWMYSTLYGVVADLDRRIGELLALLERQGLLEHTAIIFTSDHGDMLGHHGMIQKRYFYEPSMRIPWLCRFPGHWRRGARVDTPVSLIDLLPTLADFTGTDMPDDLPGTSLLPALEGEQALPERTIFAEYHGEGVHAPCFMALRGEYKYIYVHGYEERLYHLPSDMVEYHNLIADPAHVAVARQLREELLRQFDPEQIAQIARRSQLNRQCLLRLHRMREDARVINSL